MKSKKRNRNAGAPPGSPQRMVGRLTRTKAKELLGKTGVVVTIGQKDVLCEKHDDEFKTLKGIAKVRAGDSVVHDGNRLLVVEHMEDMNFLTFRTRPMPPNAALSGAERKP